MRGRWAAATVAVAAVAGCGSDAADVVPTLVTVSATGCSLAPAEAVGFVVGPSRVMTVAHAVQGADEVLVDGRAAQLVALDVRADVAVLAVDGLVGELDFADARVGDVAEVVLPDGTRAAEVLRTPTIEHTVAADGVTYSRQGVVLGVDVRPRQSGSPVVDGEGRVVAMIYARSTESAERAYAIAASELEPVLSTVDPGAVDPGEC